MLAQSRQPTHHLQGMPPVWAGRGNALLSRRVLDHLQIAIAILDSLGTVLFCNIGAQQLSRDSDVVQIGEGQPLRFLDADADRKFRAALRRFADHDPLEEESSATIIANSLDTCDHPLIGAFSLLSESPRALLATLVDSKCSPSETSLQCLMQAFHLTPAEQRLTHYLASGGCLSDAAGSFGVSRHTVRNQLRSIFDKVGVQRQADLTRLMFTGSVHGGIAQTKLTQRRTDTPLSPLRFLRGDTAACASAYSRNGAQT